MKTLFQKDETIIEAFKDKENYLFQDSRQDHT